MATSSRVRSAIIVAVTCVLARVVIVAGNVNGNFFPCGEGGGCCGNACFAAGSKCCISTFKPKSSWYPVTADTECASGFFGTTKPMAALETQPSRKQTIQEHVQ